MNRTLEQLILALPCDGATTLAIIGALKEAGLADATVYGVCPTCGGKRFVTGAEDFPGGDEGYDVTCSPCPNPDCGTVSVVTKELRDYVISDMVPGLTSVLLDVLNSVRVDCLGYAKEVGPHITDAVLSTVLGKTRTAKDMGVRVRPGHMNIPVEGENDRPRFLTAVRGDTIAILEDER